MFSDLLGKVDSLDSCGGFASLGIILVELGLLRVEFGCCDSNRPS